MSKLEPVDPEVETNLLVGVTLCTSTLSLSSIFFVIVCYIKFPKLQIYETKMILNILIGDLLMIVSIITALIWYECQ